MKNNGASTTIKSKTLKELVETGLVTKAEIVFDKENNALLGVVMVGDVHRILGGVRDGKPRYFNTIDGAVSSMQDCGINNFTVDARGFTSRGKQASARKNSAPEEQNKLSNTEE